MQAFSSAQSCWENSSKAHVLFPISRVTPASITHINNGTLGTLPESVQEHVWWSDRKAGLWSLSEQDRAHSATGE
jgi:hypothetical protein